MTNNLTGIPIDDKYNDCSWKVDANGTLDDSTKKVCDLQPNVTYSPEIIIEANITLEDNEFAKVKQRCTKNSFTIISEGWLCTNSTQRIPTSFRCDTHPDCFNEADERPEDCKGKFNHDLFNATWIYFGSGFLVIFFVGWFLTPEEKVYQLGMDDVALKPFDKVILKIFNQKLTKDSELEDDDKECIQTKYFSAKDNNNVEEIKMMFRILRFCGNPHVVEKVFQFILTIEQTFRINSCNAVIAWIMKVIQDDLILRSWIISCLRRDCSYKLSRWMELNLKPMHIALKWSRLYLVPIGFALRMIASVTFDLWKDVALFLTFNHYCQNILVSRTDSF